MNKEEIFRQVYDDFFGDKSIEARNAKLSKEIDELTKKNFENESLDSEFKKSSNNVEVEKSVENNIDKKQVFEDLNEKIDNLLVDENSKTVLKKIIDYMRKYDSKEETKYISFDMCLYTNNKEIVTNVVSILEDAGTCFKYLRKGQGAIYSMYDVEKTEDVDNLYDGANNIVALRDFEGFISKDKSFKEVALHKLEVNVNNNCNEVLTIYVAKNKEILDLAFAENEEFKVKFYDFVINGVDPDVQDAYQDILEKLKENLKLDDKQMEKIQVKLLDYVEKTLQNNTRAYPEYRDSLVEKILFNKEVPEYEKEKSLDEIFAELDALVGLQEVKKIVRELADLIELKQKTTDLKIKDVNLHMVFLGNPGTGKTTVARLIAGILYNLKYIKQNKLVEVTSKDLVAEYVGQTAPKTNEVIQKARGGVLFIDEAYALASGQGQGNSYNEEAIATLIQGMENYRDELVVIFAGYTKEMQDFLNANSGIVSRIGYTVDFKDYTPDELIKIFLSFTGKAGFEVEDKAIDKVKEIINEYKDTKNFGNARFVRNIFEKSVVKHAANTKGKKSKKILKTITEKDISSENLLKM